jgi:2-dehydro-3-deoxygluconokinase
MATVLTLGECMALLDPMQDGRIDADSCFRLRVAGAESNFAIALRRLAVPVTWVSRVGRDAFGDLVVGTIASEGVDVRHVKVHPSAPTGIYFKVRDGGRTEVLYYRSGSAASYMAPGDVPDEAWDGVGLVHLTGITMAISSTARALLMDTARLARRHGATVIFDPNYRPALWSGPNEAGAAYREVLPYTDWVLCGLEEGRTVFGVNDADGLCALLRDSGAKGAAVRVGERGAVVDDGGGPTAVEPEQLETVVDEIGAGDAFAAGFAFGLLQSWDPTDCVAVGNFVAAAALRGTGDWETCPRVEDLKPFLARMGKSAPAPP